jgi:hypothetical protein
MKKIFNPAMPYDPRKAREEMTIREEKEFNLSLTDCINCGGKIHYGYYGRWGDGGTCSKKCEREQQAEHDGGTYDKRE